MLERARGGWLVAVVLGVAAATVDVAAQDAEPFLPVHRKAEELAGQKKWAEAANAYGAFAAEHPTDLCAPLASIIHGTVLLRELKQPAEARSAFGHAVASAADTPFGRVLKDVARAWLARLQMQEIDAALRKYWVARVEYPEKLDTLVERKLIGAEKLADPWGKPFAYRLGTLKIKPDMPRQSYTLACTAIEGDSRQFKRLLAETAAFAPKYYVKEMTETHPVAAYLTPADQPTKRVVVNEGAKLGTATVVKITRKAVIVQEGEKLAVITFAPPSPGFRDSR